MPLNHENQTKLDNIIKPFKIYNFLNIATQLAQMTFENDMFLSDHLPKNYKVTEEIYDFYVMTWNMLNKCHSTTACSNQGSPYSNNPWNIDETSKQLNYRRAIQYKFILEKIENSIINSKAISVVFLQEISELALAMSKNNINEANIIAILQKPTPTPEEIGRLLGFDFLNNLEIFGYKAYATKMEMQCKPMLTIVNSNQVTIDENQNYATFLAEGTRGKNTAFVIPATVTMYEFTKRINFVNLHLDYTTNYINKILNLQVEMLQNNIIGIMAGDTNHPVNFDLIGAINNWNYPSNIDLRANAIQTHSTSSSSVDLTITDPRTFALKCYDSLFANPSTPTSKLIIEELPGWFFKISGNNTLRIMSITPQLHHIHESKEGALMDETSYI